MPADDKDEIDPALIAHSYDGILSIKTRVPKIGDLRVPKRGGATIPELVFYSLFFVTVFVVYTALLLPILQLLGVRLPLWITLAIIFLGPAALTQRFTTPMAHHKTIREAIRSKLRRLFDEPVHRRGQPVPRKRVPAATPVAHYQREWQLAADAPGADHPRYLPLVSERVHAHRAQHALDQASSELGDLQSWRASRMRHNVAQEAQERLTRTRQRRASTDLAITRYGSVHLEEETQTSQELTS